MICQMEKQNCVEQIGWIWRRKVIKNKLGHRAASSTCLLGRSAVDNRALCVPCFLAAASADSPCWRLAGVWPSSLTKRSQHIYAHVHSVYHMELTLVFTVDWMTKGWVTCARGLRWVLWLRPPAREGLWLCWAVSKACFQASPGLLPLYWTFSLPLQP